MIFNGRDIRGKQMIDFEEELRKFKPSPDISAVEDIIAKSDISDMNDILMELLKEQVKG